jgi:hypothetical protein
MSTGVGVVVGVGALLLVLYVNRRNEQATAMKANAINTAANNATLGAKDLLGAAIVAGATAAGGPVAGFRAYSMSGIRL